MVTVTGATGTGNGGTRGVTDPVTPGGLVSPSPVAYITIVDPRAAGLAALFTVLSWFRIAPWPEPPATAKIAGLVGTTFSVVSETVPLLLTTTVTTDWPF